MAAMNDAKPHILIVDDDDRLRALLKKFLSKEGFLVTAAADVASARRKLEWFLFDLMVLDVMMPGETGLSLLASLPEPKRLPVLMLSAMGEADDRIKGLEIGAEDYLAKPFEPKELVLRIRSILRRSRVETRPDKILSFGECSFDIAASALTRAGAPVPLTTNELALLKTLAEFAGAPVAREELARRMSGSSSERSVDVQVTRLRKKIETGDKPVFLQTVRGAGYVLYGKSP
jgi:two-component system, OmpR family, phosphate regulon response regulator OmpR